MLISGREAASRLTTVGVTSRQARQVLAAGLAGQPLRTRSALLYDADRVAELVARPALAEGAMERASPYGVFVARRADRLDGPWDMSPWSSVLIRARIAEHGCFPLVATVAGFVVGGAEVTDVRTKGHRQRVLRLGPAGEWFGEFAGRRWPTGPGRPWVLYRGPGLRGLVSMGESGP